ncbi:MAG: polyphosphate kinase 1, partial [Candidatus Omnitrophica bacterium]|nr:polyphosphate kinase 1 [Candidatus Omnitrophota bacterium]
MTKKDPSKKQRYIPRDRSWLAFNERVLEEAVDTDNPLLERVKFLAIFVSNLDEFFAVRIASMENLVDSKFNRKDLFGFYPQDLLKELKTTSAALIKRMYKIYTDKTLKELQKQNITIQQYSQLKKDHKRFVSDYFSTTLYPIITPMAVDPGHPFPALPSRTIALAVTLKRKNEKHLAIVPVPKVVNRLLRLPTNEDQHAFILVEEIIRQHLGEFFSGYKIMETSLFRIIRDSELTVEEEYTPDLLEAIESEVRKRHLAKTIYLEVQEGISHELMDHLCEGLKFEKKEAVFIKYEFDLTFCFELIKQTNRQDLCYKGYIPPNLESEDIFATIKERDFMVHLPFQSFDPTVDLIERAAKDFQVLAIKMTLYRTNRGSAIIEALKEAARNNKQVTILVEIKARFDEENNIRWVRELEEAGCHVIYGIPGLKIHSKMALIVRQEESGILRYVHLSTGNYNESTASVYTDIGYFTANEDIARDISDLFNVITGYSVPLPWKRVVSSPDNLRDYFFSLIDREIHHQKKNKNGLIFAKMNSLEDPFMIDNLYQASQAGVI